MRVLMLVPCLAMAVQSGPHGQDALRLVATVPLANVEGRIDHLAVDLEQRRLFVAALGNNTLEVIDLTAMRVSRSVGGLHEPQGIRYLPEQHRIVVANGEDGAVNFFDDASFAAAHTTPLSGDADNVRYDATSRRLYVGYAGGALAVLDPDGNHLGDVRLAGHPESFQLETSGPRIFVNVPSSGHIAVIDRDTLIVTTTWPVTAAGANFPMALDETNHRLFIGCRRPARLLVYDTTTGRLVTDLEITGDTDDVFYDAVTKRIYVSGGEGFISVVQQRDPDHYQTLQRLATAAGARTSLFVQELRRLFLAVPHRDAQRAEIRVYDASTDTGRNLLNPGLSAGHAEPSR